MINIGRCRVKIWVLIVLGVSLSIGWYLLSNQTSMFQVSDTVLLEMESPDQKFVASVFVRDVGATVNFSTMVNLRGDNENFDPEQGRLFVVSGEPLVSLSWVGNSNLTISCDVDSEKVFKRELVLGDVKIDYPNL